MFKLPAPIQRATGALKKYWNGVPYKHFSVSFARDLGGFDLGSIGLAFGTICTVNGVFSLQLFAILTVPAITQEFTIEDYLRSSFDMALLISVVSVILLVSSLLVRYPETKFGAFMGLIFAAAFLIFYLKYPGDPILFGLGLLTAWATLCSRLRLINAQRTNPSHLFLFVLPASLIFTFGDVKSSIVNFLSDQGRPIILVGEDESAAGVVVLPLHDGVIVHNCGSADFHYYRWDHVKKIDFPRARGQSLCRKATKNA